MAKFQIRYEQRELVPNGASAGSFDEMGRENTVNGLESGGFTVWRGRRAPSNEDIQEAVSKVGYSLGDSVEVVPFDPIGLGHRLVVSEKIDRVRHDVGFVILSRPEGIDTSIGLAAVVDIRLHSSSRPEPPNAA